MKKFIAFIFCMTVIPALILIGVAGFIYNSYFKPSPIEYEMLRGQEEIYSVDYAIISFSEDGNVIADGIGCVDDVEGFVKDLTSIDCYEGISLESVQALNGIKTLSGFVINYTDGSFEVITPYVCLNSELNISGISDLLEADVYCFDKTGINQMLIKYAPASTGTVI